VRGHVLGEAVGGGADFVDAEGEEFDGHERESGVYVGIFGDGFEDVGDA
jgi:hypothetical protein